MATETLQRLLPNQVRLVLDAQFDALVLAAGPRDFSVPPRPANAAGVSPTRAYRSNREEILISGGGRCNSPNHCQPENSFLRMNTSRNPRWRGTRPRISSRWSRSIAFLTTKKRSATLLRPLRSGHHRLAGIGVPGAECKLSTQPIEEVQRTSEFVYAPNPANSAPPVLVVATGGLSIPKMGATPFATNWRANSDSKSADPSPNMKRSAGIAARSSRDG